MGSIGCVQGQAEGHREPLVLVPISEGISQDILESFGVQESQEGLQDLHLALEWEQLTLLFSGEMREFLPAQLGDLDWSSRERSLSGCLVQSWVSGFAIHLGIGLSEVEGDAFLEALGVDRMEDHPVVEMEGTWRLWMPSSSAQTSTGLPFVKRTNLQIPHLISRR